MKTLEEVIKANECCDHGEPDSRCEDCPYNGIGACCAERESDALHYLKEYRKLDSIDAVTFPEDDNPALSWDELRQMEGKPVWVECENFFCSQWVILTNVYDEKAMFIGDRIVDSELKEEMGDVWQAYRKER